MIDQESLYSNGNSYLQMNIFEVRSAIHTEQGTGFIHLSNQSKPKTMNNTTIQTLSFLFDNETDYILLHQEAGKGSRKRLHSGIKGSIWALEDLNVAAIRSIRDASGLEVSNATLRGVIKTIQEESQTSVIYFVYESARYSGVMENNQPGRLKWVDILNIFNLDMEGMVHELMPNLLDGESFFEGTIQLGVNEEVISSEIRICNSF